MTLVVLLLRCPAPRIFYFSFFSSRKSSRRVVGGLVGKAGELRRTKPAILGSFLPPSQTNPGKCHRGLSPTPGCETQKKGAVDKIRDISVERHGCNAGANARLAAEAASFHLTGPIRRFWKRTSKSVFLVRKFDAEQSFERRLGVGNRPLAGLQRKDPPARQNTSQNRLWHKGYLRYIPVLFASPDNLLFPCKIGH